MQCNHPFAACSTANEDYEGMTEWLKHNVEPENTVKEFMKKTSIKRAAWIRGNPSLTVEAILKEHPRLFDTPGMVSLGNAMFQFFSWCNAFFMSMLSNILCPIITRMVACNFNLHDLADPETTFNY